MSKDGFSESAAINIVLLPLELFLLAYFLVDNRKWDIYYINHVNQENHDKMTNFSWPQNREEKIFEKQKFYII